LTTISRLQSNVWSTIAGEDRVFAVLSSAVLIVTIMLGYADGRFGGNLEHVAMLLWLFALTVAIVALLFFVWRACFFRARRPLPGVLWLRSMTIVALIGSPGLFYAAANRAAVDAIHSVGIQPIARECREMLNRRQFGRKTPDELQDYPALRRLHPNFVCADKGWVWIGSNAYWLEFSMGQGTWRLFLEPPTGRLGPNSRSLGHGISTELEQKTPT
jgi:hypothetical protein